MPMQVAAWMRCRLQVDQRAVVAAADAASVVTGVLE
jgi:hypothetical protein